MKKTTLFWTIGLLIATATILLTSCDSKSSPEQAPKAVQQVEKKDREPVPIQDSVTNILQEPLVKLALINLPEKKNLKVITAEVNNDVTIVLTDLATTKKVNIFYFNIGSLGENIAIERMYADDKKQLTILFTYDYNHHLSVAGSQLTSPGDTTCLSQADVEKIIQNSYRL